MAKEIYDERIGMSTDWGGDYSTDYKPVSGRRVQEFIKEQINSKIGYLYYDSFNNRYLAFANIQAKDIYIQDPENNTNLILGTFDAPFNYNAEINMITPTYVAILVGQKNNNISFTFDIKNKNGQSIGEDVIANFTITKNGIQKTISQKYHNGQVVVFNVDEYIETGTNSIQINIIGQSTLASTTVNITYQVVDLILTDEYNISNELTPENSILEIPYYISGFGTKTMEWYIDGNKVNFVKAEDEINEVSTSKVKYLNVGSLNHGTHSLQFRAFTIINGEYFYSKLFYREFIYNTGENEDPIITVGTEFSQNTNIIQGDLVIKDVTQFVTYDLKLALFNPTYAAVTPLNVYLNDLLQTTLSMSNNIVENYSLSIDEYGDVYLKLTAGNTTRNIKLIVEKSSTSLEEITEGLSLVLKAIGKNNNSSDKDSWTFGNYSTTFNNFDWNENSGWNNNRLIISDGAYIDVNFAPLANDSLINGKTIELEFESNSVQDNDAVICDLKNEDGTGLLITASEVSLKSANGVSVSTKYKAEENIRISIVINKKANTANKLLTFIYVNGVVSGAANFIETDNFIVTKQLRITSENGSNIALKDIRVYENALSDEQILTNYILNRDTAEELRKVYDRNNIYNAGTTDFSADILSGQLPVMIITGNIPALEATTDKNLQIDVDVEYINIQDPSRSFTLKNAALRPQGTSSMAYPKKNFRLYTDKKDTTILYDANGNEITSKKYSFKENAQPVNCWCFKADYAESSGTHNTGIARLWNDVMKDTYINNNYPLRTNAQKAAIDNNYSYDVRTTIDGFPIIMFYRLDENSPLVFIGKYNFNNDKSTESVFGFCDIPEFDNSNMQCWEVLNNGHHLALFKDTNSWDLEWNDAFEGRYPDGNQDTTNLKAFATWMSTVTQDDFSTQKWNHIDVYKVAAYYIYLMRFGAVDQVVKNSMFTSEDGIHWYFINYDNDTINGLRNDGPLIYPPTIDRNTLDTSFSSTVYCYAGHDSRLWNMLEADEEFMTIVNNIDQALYTAGLTYDKVIDIFDNKQAGKWCERIYNRDAQYKYIGPFSDRGINNLFMLQGSRQSHRRWWLSERFALMDAKFVSGEYKANTFEVKLAGAPIGLPFSIKSGSDMYYGYGVNDVPINTGIFLSKGEQHIFNTTSVLNVGDPLRLYAAPYIRYINIKSFLPYLSQISISGVYSNRLSSKLKTLILGDVESDEENTSLTELSGINQAIALEELNVAGVKGIPSLNLSNNKNLKKLEARNSGLTSVIFAKGCPLTYFGVPDSMRALSLSDLPKLANSSLIFNNNGWNIADITIKNCPNINTYNLVSTWLTGKSTADNGCSLTLEGIHWTGVNAAMLIRFGNFRNIALKGVIEIDEIEDSQINKLYEIYGNNCFNSNSELYIKINTDVAFIFGSDTVKGLSTSRYQVITGKEGIISWTTSNLPDNITFESGLLTVGDVDSFSNINLTVLFNGFDGSIITLSKQIQLQPRTYPQGGTFAGLSFLTKVGVFNYSFTVDDGLYDGNFILNVSPSFKATDDFISKVSIGNIIRTGNKISFDITINELFVGDFGLNIECLVAETERVIFETSFDVVVSSGSIIMTKANNSAIMDICYNQGWAANPNFMTKEEAESVTDVGNAFDNVVADSFNEFQYFINVLYEDLSLYFARYIKEISLPWSEISTNNATTIYWLQGYEGNLEILRCPNLTILNELIMHKIAINLNKIKELYLPVLYKFKGNCFIRANALEKLYAPVLYEIDYVTITSNISNHVFTLPKLLTLDLPSLTKIKVSKFTVLSSSNTTYTCIFNINSSYNVTINLPNLVTFENDKTYKVRLVDGKVKTLNLNSLKNIISPLDIYCRELTDNEVTNINLNSLESTENTEILVLNNKTAINLNSLKTFGTNSGRLNIYLSHLDLPNIESADCESYKYIIYPYNYISGTAYTYNSISFGQHIKDLGKFISNKSYTLRYVNTLYIYAKQAPLISVSTDTNLTDSDEEKILYVPINAIGYDSGNWPNWLEKTGFTISYTLPAVIEEIEGGFGEKL